MRTYLGLILGNRLKHFCHSVADIVLDNVSDKQHRDEHTDARIYQEKEVIGLVIEPGGQRVMDEFD